MIRKIATKKFTRDERAVSLSVGFMLTLAITLITTMVLISSFYTMMDRAEHTVMRDEFEIHGNDISLQISNIDTAVQITNNAGGRVESITYQLILPDTIANKQYSVEFSGHPGTKEIIFESEGREESKVKVAYTTNAVNVTPTKLYSGSNDFVLHYNATSNMLEIY
jgi:FlaG/FlaF family flagellin (archaellin)